jgi:hypothetical protein
MEFAGGGAQERAVDVEEDGAESHDRRWGKLAARCRSHGQKPGAASSLTGSSPVDW